MNHWRIVIFILFFLLGYRCAEAFQYDLSILDCPSDRTYDIVELEVNGKIHRLLVKDADLKASTSEWVDKVLKYENITE